MLTQIPFIYINILALSCFCLLTVTMLAAKKTPAIHAFIVILINCILWTGSSVLMRLQMWPGMHFWYYVSLVTLFLMELLFFYFLQTFYQIKDRRTLGAAIIGTLAILPGTIAGVYLAPPTPVIQPDGSTVFLYSITWQLLIPCLILLVLTIQIARLFLKLMRTQGIHSPGLVVIMGGGFIMLMGNLAQVTIPNNIFPYDCLGGIILAGCLTYALYRKRIFQMTLLVSRWVLTTVLSILCIAFASYLIDPLIRFTRETLQLGLQNGSVFSTLVFTCFAVLLLELVRRTVDAMFSREERQSRQIRQFSSQVSQTLHPNEVMEQLSHAVQAELHPQRTYICRNTNGAFRGAYCSDSRQSIDFSIPATSPLISQLKSDDGLLVVSEFRRSPLFFSVSDEEKALFDDLGISHAAAIQDDQEIIGLMLICIGNSKPLNSSLTAYLQTLCSVGFIALKNAGLYEMMYREARIDPLTGVYNYRYFVEQNTEVFRLCKDDCLSLMFVDVDDFKLYNQLYGIGVGDETLHRISKAIARCVGSRGQVFRTSGKVFAVLLPHVNDQTAQQIGEDICQCVRDVNPSRSFSDRKTTTVSIGICTAPQAAGTPKELMDNADQATYCAKQAGKDRVSLFRGTASIPKTLADRTEPIIERMESSEEMALSAFDMIAALTAAIDAKDHYTYRHSKHVARYAANLAVAMGLNDHQVSTIYTAGLLHDIGKISIPERILSKPGQLTDEEYDIMKGHVNNSIEMIRHMPDMDNLLPAAMGHHERWDGRGYPRGISGMDIPMSARCLAVADAFDAMVTDRPYRKGLPIQKAVDEILRGAGTQFDPELAQVFAQLITNQEIPSLR